MKQEGLIRHYGILQKMEDSTRYAKEGNKINIEDLLEKDKDQLLVGICAALEQDLKLPAILFLRVNTASFIYISTARWNLILPVYITTAGIGKFILVVTSDIRQRRFLVLVWERGRLLGFIDLMRQKNKRMKQEGLIRHYGILQKIEDSTRYAKEGNKINIKDLLEKDKDQVNAD
ncbi:hypothetical protein Tco_1386046 [Tanacetum coccineum]